MFYDIMIIQYESNIYMLHDSLHTVASASYVLASASQKKFGLGLTLSGLVLCLGLILLWPQQQACILRITTSDY